MTSATKTASRWGARRILTTLAMLALTAGLLCDSACATDGVPASGAHVQEYGVFSDNQRLGSITITTRGVPGDAGPALEIAVSTRLRSELFGMTVFSLESDRTTMIDDRGLIRADGVATVDDERTSFHLRRSDATLAAEIQRGGRRRTVQFSDGDYDFSTFDDLLSQLGEPGQPKTFKVLDLEDLKIVERTFTWLRDETVDIGGTRVPGRVVDVSDSKTHARRWLAKDALGTLLREEGTDETGAYRIVLDRYEAPAALPAGD